MMLAAHRTELYVGSRYFVRRVKKVRISQGWAGLSVVLAVLYTYCLASSTVLLPAGTGRDRSLLDEEVF